MYEKFINMVKGQIISNCKRFDRNMQLRDNFSTTQLFNNIHKMSLEDGEKKFNKIFSYVYIKTKKEGTVLPNDIEVGVALLRNLAIYKNIQDSLFFIDDDFIEYARDFSLDDFKNKTLSSISSFSVIYNNMLYSVLFDKGTNTYSVKSYSGKDSGIAVNINAKISSDKVDIEKHNIRCDNYSCPKFKDCQAGNILNYDGIENCDISEHYLSPLDLAKVVQVLLLVFNNRSDLHSNTLIKKSDIKSSPDTKNSCNSENTNPVLVYFGKNSRIVPVSDLEPRNYRSSGSHASPRRHYRKGANVREYSYVNKYGTEVVISAHSRKGGVVNDDHTSCTYKLKERKS